METFSDPSTIGTVSTLEDLINRLTEVFSEDCVNVEYVKALMSSYKSKPSEWKKYAHFDPHRYTRNLVDKGNGKFNLMILCWGENQGSSIHSHAGSHCFLKVLDGSMVETMYDWPDDHIPSTTTICEEASDNINMDCGMKKKEMLQFKKDEVTYINDSLGLHRMENPSHSECAVSLHLYSPPFEKCYCFDERTAKQVTSTMTFWTKFGERTPFMVPRPSICDELIKSEAENN